MGLSIEPVEKTKAGQAFRCPKTGTRIDDYMCREWRNRYPACCINCLIPLAGDGSALCMKCGRPYSKQEKDAGFETCEFCATPHPRPLPVRGEGEKQEADPSLRSGGAA